MNNIENYRKRLDDLRERINYQLESYFKYKLDECNDSKIAHVIEKLRDFTMNGGKRVRPILMIMGYSMFAEPDDRIIYKDIEREFRVNDVELLKNLIKMISNRPGMTLNFKAISENIGRDQRTISNYFEYLEFGLLVKIIYNYRENEFISLRKLKKCYPVTPNIVFALSDKFNELMPYIMENLVLMNIRTNYFYKNNYEIDFISVKKDKIMPVEVKKTDRSEKQLKLFIKKYGNKVENPLMVTYDNESNDNITVIPLWKFLLEF